MRTSGCTRTAAPRFSLGARVSFDAGFAAGARLRRQSVIQNVNHHSVTMLCMCCHERTATVHVTTVKEDGSQERRDLCEACTEEPYGAPSVKDWTDTVSKQRCEFCREPATSGSAGPGRERFWCQRCAEHFGRILQKVYSESSKPENTSELLRWIEISMDEAGRRMRSHLSEGGTDG